ncbi:thiol:disulfide interchange protein DsbD [Tsuneonella deserti]|uniref:Thiol:disulfide interchange protein DsbD n=1 Tax=Tsuneonella deserti TaxID=2035528 RepID=A0ABQ1S489_9SPHN|nr:thiol:disulfide interchange protein DsbD [Tsuneonella deserti]
MPLLAAICALIALLLPGHPSAQGAPDSRPNHIAARLLAEGPVRPGEPLSLAIAFDPEPGWHGYWKNPGDAGYGLTLDWHLPSGWKAGEPQYPVPQQLVVGGLMNHVYEGPYAVLVEVAVPKGARAAPIAVDAQWLACTDKICVPEQARLTVDLGHASRDARFDRWRAEIPALLDQKASFAIDGDRLRVAIPLPASLDKPAPHLFVEQRDLVQYAQPQAFFTKGDLLVAEVPLAATMVRPVTVDGILSLGHGDGVRFLAVPGDVPAGGEPLPTDSDIASPLWLLVLAALAGGLLLNVMPCVFPILSLKALSLARAGESDAHARIEGLAYTAGVVLATLALGAVLLALRAAGEMVGWAFQLQEPAVVVALLALAAAITANFAGLFEVPSFSLTRGGEPSGAFLTGLLAAFVATPCTGPFMAAAMGAALLLPEAQAMLLFGTLGLGLALPFLLLGFVPPLRRMLPRPGRWMDTFRKAMAVPMGLTALALLWLCWRIGGGWFAAGAALLASLVVVALAAWWRSRLADGGRGRGLAVGAALLVALLAIVLPTRMVRPATAEEGIVPTRPFSEAALAKARASGQPVFVWFTADWCLTCKVNERVAIEREATRDAFEKAGVVAMVGDWTRRDPAIARYLSRQGAAGVPLYVWYAPGKEGEILPQVLTPDSLVTLAEGLPQAGS